VGANVDRSASRHYDNNGVFFLCRIDSDGR
jgi:hypothetical protein